MLALWVMPCEASLATKAMVGCVAFLLLSKPRVSEAELLAHGLPQLCPLNSSVMESSFLGSKSRPLHLPFW